ncbi:hypothetical protein BOTBODRAFT_55715 [Botryobasidium botryosum FD-172 SS1]|uniref:Uncharacterized protein n=1 Tax=Botryobasidium botryosum (strain FD-172 SS1) TaxID=930990 RepID=A0A067MQX2_BOTB1|nr:hypothetical protein BOTBODRAFT_55715 [Botryobasidium botryosum FD-172 SS1]
MASTLFAVNSLHGPKLRKRPESGHSRIREPQGYSTMAAYAASIIAGALTAPIVQPRPRSLIDSPWPETITHLENVASSMSPNWILPEDLGKALDNQQGSLLVHSHLSTYSGSPEEVDIPLPTPDFKVLSISPVPSEAKPREPLPGSYKSVESQSSSRQVTASPVAAAASNPPERNRPEWVDLKMPRPRHSISALSLAASCVEPEEPVEPANTFSSHDSAGNRRHGASPAIDPYRGVATPPLSARPISSSWVGPGLFSKGKAKSRSLPPHPQAHRLGPTTSGSKHASKLPMSSGPSSIRFPTSASSDSPDIRGRDASEIPSRKGYSPALPPSPPPQYQYPNISIKKIEEAQIMFRQQYTILPPAVQQLRQQGSTRTRHRPTSLTSTAIARLSIFSTLLEENVTSDDSPTSPRRPSALPSSDEVVFPRRFLQSMPGARC